MPPTSCSAWGDAVTDSEAPWVMRPIQPGTLGTFPVQAQKWAPAPEPSEDPQDQFIPSHMETIREQALPPEAKRMMEVMAEQRAYPGFRNNIVFENREGRLPAKPDGYYKEWTVKKRGKSGRGKLRLVAGQNNELYFTTNHYKSFRWVVRGS